LVFRILCEIGVFNADPHPADYCSTGAARLPSLDFGLVKRFNVAEREPLMQMSSDICIEHHARAFRRTLERGIPSSRARRSSQMRSSSISPSLRHRPCVSAAEHH
jgi:predicted unusual protein kinase regulating ubiquinone biosynthesis (AarF/ABC1/UbiB family)